MLPDTSYSTDPCLLLLSMPYYLLTKKLLAVRESLDLEIYYMFAAGLLFPTPSMVRMKLREFFILETFFFSSFGIRISNSSAEGLFLGFLSKQRLIMPCKAEL